MHFVVIGAIERIETIAVGGRIREIMRLRKQFGSGRWRKMKGIAQWSALKMIVFGTQNYIGTRHTASDGVK